MLLLRLIYNELLAFNRYFEGDKRFKAYPLMDKPWPMIAILIIYGLTALKWGPKFMAKRKPFKVDGIMKLYNVVQVLLNAWAVLEGAKIIFVGNDIKLICQEYIPNNTSPAIMSLLAPTLAYCYMKYLDLFDTLFFLARKKFNQVTFLHVYHHITMVLCVHLYMVNLYDNRILF
ncbi:hypothetical protein DOY81_001193 [Sarcophaga bullata]|nr:hypothetical protein DOY81_001193 [Sarcophaga bullata]